MMFARHTQEVDPVLSHTRRAADDLLRVLSREPASRRASAMRSALTQFDPTLPTRVSQTVQYLRRQGETPAAALREGLARSLADASIVRIQRIGAGRAAMPALGQVATSPTPTSPDAGAVIGSMFQGLACNPQLRDATLRLVQQHGDATATGITATGFSFAGGAANCPGSMESLPVPATPASEDMSSVTAPAAWVPAAIGLGAVLIIGIAAVATRPR